MSVLAQQEDFRRIVLRGANVASYKFALESLTLSGGGASVPGELHPVIPTVTTARPRNRSGAERSGGIPIGEVRDFLPRLSDR